VSKTFAERVRSLQPEGAYAVLARAKALEAQGREIIHLEIGQPDFPTPPHVAQAGVDAILAGRTRYTPPAGAADLRAAIAEVAGRQRGLAFSPEEVVIGPGAKPAIFFPLLALIGPGDEVILPDPGFPSYTAAVRVAGGVPVPVRLREMRGPDVVELAARIGPRTRLIILNSPSNPTGGVIPPADLEQIAVLARQADLWVLSDEIYSQLVYEGEAASIATLPGMRERTIVVEGFSKTYAMTGWRLGFGIMPPALAERVELLLTHSVGCTSDFTQAAGIAALRGEQSAVAAMRASFRVRRDRTVAALNSIPGVRCPVPQGAFYVFPDVRSFGWPSKKLAEYLLDAAGVALLPGSDFGPGGEGYLRISYATAWERIETAVERMRAALARLARTA
jgi:aspartate/methionine/tyrosine aminotransferase